MTEQPPEKWAALQRAWADLGLLREINQNLLFSLENITQRLSPYRIDYDIGDDPDEDGIERALDFACQEARAAIAKATTCL